MATIEAFMPPYLPEEYITDEQGQTSYSGAAAELAVRSWLTFSGRLCATPEVDRNGVDLWVDGHRRAQVKKVVRRGDTCVFWWQSPSSSRKRYTCNDIDIYYQVIFTNLRLLIFEIPTYVIPVKDSEEFIASTQLNLSNDYTQRKRPNFDIREYCVHQLYHPSLFQ